MMPWDKRDNFYQLSYGSHTRIYSAKIGDIKQIRGLAYEDVWSHDLKIIYF